MEQVLIFEAVLVGNRFASHVRAKLSDLMRNLGLIVFAHFEFVIL